MKFGVHAGLWMTRWTDDIAPIVKQVAELGFDGVEVSLLGMTETMAQSIATLATDHGLEVTCTDGLPAGADISSSDAQQRALGHAHMSRSIDLAARMGASCLAGVLYAPWGQFAPLEIAERTERTANGLCSLADRLEHHDMILAIEAINRFETDLVNTAAQAIDLVEMIDLERVGILLDTFHMNIEEKDITAAIIEAGDRLFHFHVSDNDRGVPGSGHVPWPDVSASLARLGYERWIVAEMFVAAGTPAAADLNIWRNIETDPTQAARDALVFMKETFR